MLHTAHKRAGFTLIELLLVVSIIAIITGGIVPAFSTYMQDQDLTQAQEQLKNDLRSVQNRALAGAMSESEVGGNRVRFWGVQLVSSSSSYNYFITDVASACPPTNKEVQGAYSLSSDIVIKAGTFNAPSPGCIFFSFVNGDVTAINMTEDAGFVPIIIGEPVGASDCRRIELNEPGLIRLSSDKDC